MIHSAIADGHSIGTETILSYRAIDLIPPVDASFNGNYLHVKFAHNSSWRPVRIPGTVARSRDGSPFKRFRFKFVRHADRTDL